MTASLTDYLGRLSDLSVYEISGKQLLPRLDATGVGGKIVTGLQKLVQQVLIKLFTAKGTVRHFPDDGCEFLLDVWSGSLRTEFDVFASFATAAVDIRYQLKQDETAETPLDERLRQLELSQVEFVDDRVSLWITLGTAAGSGTTFILPIPASLQ